MAKQHQLSNDAPTIEQLQAAITDMDAASQSAFKEIDGLTHLVLHVIDTNDRWTKLAIRQALRSIQNRCADSMNVINSRAEDVGCNYREVRNGNA